MTEEECVAINAKVQEYCQYWVQILGLQKWTVIAQITDDTAQEMVFNVQTGAASIPVVTEERWQKVYPNLAYDMEIAMVHNLLRLVLEAKKPSLSLNYLARVLVQFKRTILTKGT